MYFTLYKKGRFRWKLRIIYGWKSTRAMNIALFSYSWGAMKGSIMYEVGIFECTGTKANAAVSRGLNTGFINYLSLHVNVLS
jgi:hypothetical protein